MKLDTYTIDLFAYKHPIIWWLTTRFIFVSLVVIALLVAVTSVLFIVCFFWMLDHGMQNAFAAIPIAIVVGFIAYCLGALAEAFCYRWF